MLSHKFRRRTSLDKPTLGGDGNHPEFDLDDGKLGKETVKKGVKAALLAETELGRD